MFGERESNLPGPRATRVGLLEESILCRLSELGDTKPAEEGSVSLNEIVNVRRVKSREDADFPLAKSGEEGVQLQSQRLFEETNKVLCPKYVRQEVEAGVSIP